MKCDEVHERLATYLDDEVTAEEGRALRAHLENCPACWAEMAALWAVQSRVKRALGADAARVEAPADAWDRLRARLAFEPSPTVDAPARYESERTPHAAQRPVRQSLVVKVLSLAAMVVMMALFVGLILVPEMNRRSQPSAPGGNTPTAMATTVPEATVTPTPAVVPTAFRPLEPLLGLDGATGITVDSAPEGWSRRVSFTAGDEILILEQRPAQPDDSLPEGETITIGGQPAIEQAGIAGGFTAAGQNTDGLNLWWMAHGSYLHIWSNLPRSTVEQFADGLALTFSPFALATQPDGFYAWKGIITVDAGLMRTEDRYYGNQQFVVLRQVADTGKPLPAGQPVEVNGQPGVLEEGLNGSAHLADDIFDLPGQPIGGGGGGGGLDTEPHLNPPIIDYTNAIRLTWTQDGVRVEMLSNLPLDEMQQFAASLQPSSAHVHFQIGPVIDYAAMLAGKGGLISYDVTAGGSQPPDFYTGSAMSATDGQQIITEMRYNGNDRFAILTIMPDSGQPFDGLPVTVGGQPAALQDNQSGTALLTGQTFQDGQQPLPLGGGGGGGPAPDGITPTYPATIDFTDGYRLAWRSNGAYLTLLSNLSEQETLDFAAGVLVRGRLYYFFNPITGNSTEVQDGGFTPMAPTWLPDGLDLTANLSPDASTIRLAYYNTDDADPRFVLIEERAAQPGEVLPEGGPSLISKALAVVEENVSGVFDVPMDFGIPKYVVYNSAVRVTMIAEGTWVQITANLSNLDAQTIMLRTNPIR